MPKSIFISGYHLLKKPEILKQVMYELNKQYRQKAIGDGIVSSIEFLTCGDELYELTIYQRNKGIEDVLSSSDFVSQRSDRPDLIMQLTMNRYASEIDIYSTNVADDDFSTNAIQTRLGKTDYQSLISGQVDFIIS